MSSNASLSSPPAEFAAAPAATPASKPKSSTKKSATVKKPAVTKSKSAVGAKAKPASKTQSKTPKPKSGGSSHPSWKDIITECIVANKEDARLGVSRATIKKYAEEMYHLEFTASNVYQLNRAISTGAESGMFALPKGLSGKVKLAPKVKSGGVAKENSKPPSKSGSKVATKPTGAKKPVATKVTAKKADGKKTMAGKAKSAARTTTTKKSTSSTKRGTAKKAVTGSTAGAKAKAAATKKVSAKKASAKPGSRGRKI